MHAQTVATFRDDALRLLVDDGTLIRIRCITCIREWFASPEMSTPKDEWRCSRCASEPRAVRYGEDVIPSVLCDCDLRLTT